MNILDNSKEYFESLSDEEFENLLKEYEFNYIKIEKDKQTSPMRINIGEESMKVYLDKSNKDILKIDTILKLGQLEIYKDDYSRLTNCQRLIQHLQNVYPDTKFRIELTTGEINLLYSNKKYINNNGFLDNIIHIAENYLDYEDLWKLTTSYDLEMEK